MQKRNRFLVVAFLLTALSVQMFAQDFPRPTGIYALGEGVRQSMPRMDNIRDYSFVDGYAWRAGWTDFEVDSVVYDFSHIKTVVTDLQSKGLKMTLYMFADEIPDDILNRPNAITYYDVDDELKIVPWDSTALTRWKKFCEALGDYQIPDEDMGGQPVELRNHSVITQVNCSLLGLRGFRDKSNKLADSAVYDRNLFIDGSIQSIKAMMDQFPDKFHSIGFWAIEDNINQPPLADFLIDTFRNEFDGVKNPRLGFFQENLACSTPITTFSWPLYNEQDNTFIMFQMLQSWVNPFRNPERTNPCLTDSSGPDIGIEYAYNTYNCRYFEVYAPDLDYSPFHLKLQEWHDRLEDVSTTIENSYTPNPDQFKLSQNYPNPFNPVTQIGYSIPENAHVLLEIYDGAGRKIKTLVNSYKAGRSLYTVKWNGRNNLDNKVVSGIYFYRIHVTGKTKVFTDINKMLFIK